jgi:ribonuclease PH
VFLSDGRLVEVQGSAEGQPFSVEQLTEMVERARVACCEIEVLQRATLGLPAPEGGVT